MRRCCNVLAFLCIIAVSSFAKADTINFTVTITSQQNLHNIPVGTVYTGFVHYAGSVDPNFTGYPPTLDSYGFNFPSAPSSLSDFKWEFVQRHGIGQPLFVELMYVDESYPGASFSLVADTFETIIPNSITDNAVGYTVGETGTVTYTYEKDAPSSVPEPSSLTLLGTGLFGILGLVRYKTAGA
jgi:hypothetical protein